MKNDDANTLSHEIDLSIGDVLIPNDLVLLKYAEN